MEPILSIRHLSLSLPVKKGMVSILHDVSLDVAPGQILGLVGESGSGKSMTAFAVTRLLPGGGREKIGGSIRFCGEELTEKSEKDMQAIRGRDISMIFQEPMTCLNPVFTIGRQMTDVLMTHQRISRSEAMKKAEDMLTSVHIRQAADVLRCYPYELSGGMRQRVMIGIALSCRPKLLIADEPTTALDVTIQAQILDLLRGLKDKINASIMLITHDLGVIAEMADYVVVMYAGRVVEKGTVQEIFANPAHPYTIGLMASKPVINKRVDRLYSIPGKVPNPIDMPDYCYFRDRCEMCVEGCKGKYPHEIHLTDTHVVSCYRYAENGKEGK